MPTRRRLAVLAAAGLSPRPVLAQAAFPPGFLWGVAASAPQTEGRAGRGESVWDRFAAQPGRIKDGSDGREGVAFERAYATDIGLVADAGLRAFRFSLAWPRVQPDGPGAPSAAGLDLYDRVVDAMLARGVEPWPTLLHWDVPAWIEGDWRNRDVALRMAEYAAVVARRLGDRVRHWIVLNEPSTVALLGYAFGLHAPGLASREGYLAAVHHQNLAQGMAFRALRAALPADRRVGTTLNLQPCRPEGGRAENAEAAAILEDAANGVFLDPLYGRPYPARFAGELARLARPGDMEAIAALPDFLGVNYYGRFYATAAPGTPLGAKPGRAPDGVALTGSGNPVEPDGLAEMLLRLRADYGNPVLYVTETGASFPDPAPVGGVVEDPARVAFIREYLTAAAGAVARGADLRGLFYWSPTDNWEWADGFTQHFGLIQVDRATMRRTPKRSLLYLGDCARRNGVA